MKEITTIIYEATCGNSDAAVFLFAWYAYIHEIDDLVDGDKQFNAESLIKLLMHSNALYSTPFYVTNSQRLSGVVASIANTYADSVAWENDSTAWKRSVADVLRLCGSDMILAVACICGGFQHMRNISLRLREKAWVSQHDEVTNG